MARLILASSSPRRKELLHAMRIPFEVHSADVDESCLLPAGDAVVELSRRKGVAVAPLFPGAFVLSADTLVEAGGASLGKPQDRNDVIRMLRLLAGRTHRVYTGITVISPEGGCFSAADCSEVTFTDIPEEEIKAYAECDEPFDKAGAYAVQGRAGMWITRIVGSPSCVIGLSMSLVRDLLLRAGYPLLDTLKSNTEG